MILHQERINSQNYFNAAANVAADQLLKLLTGWNGRKIWRVSGHGGPVAKLKAELKALSDASGWNVENQPFVCLVCRHGNLAAFFRGTFAGRQLSTDLHLGVVDVEDGVLRRLYEWERRRTDYTVEGVRVATERAYALESEARKLRRSVSEFSNR